jgi:hypothetical protein
MEGEDAAILPYQAALIGNTQTHGERETIRIRRSIGIDRGPFDSEGHTLAQRIDIDFAEVPVDGPSESAIPILRDEVTLGGLYARRNGELVRV